MSRARQLGSLWAGVQKTLVFLGGMAGFVQQTFFAHRAQTPLLILFAGMMGLPSLLHIESIQFGKPDSEKSSKGSP